MKNNNLVYLVTEKICLFIFQSIFHHNISTFINVLKNENVIKRLNI